MAVVGDILVGDLLEASDGALYVVLSNYDDPRPIVLQALRGERARRTETLTALRETYQRVWFEPVFGNHEVVSIRRVPAPS